MEQRITQKEDALDKKSEALEQQKSNLLKQEEDIKVLQEKISSQHELMVQELEKVAQLTREEAKRLLTEEILDSTRHDVAIQVRNMEQQAKDEADHQRQKDHRARHSEMRRGSGVGNHRFRRAAA